MRKIIIITLFFTGLNSFKKKSFILSFFIIMFLGQFFIFNSANALSQDRKKLSHEILRDNICYLVYDDELRNAGGVGGRCFDANRGKVEKFDTIRFELSNDDKFEDKISKVYYYFDKVKHKELNGDATEYRPEYFYKSLTISEKINIEEPGQYYFSFFVEDSNNDIVGPIYYRYVYEPEFFKNIKTLQFYKDKDRDENLGKYKIKTENFESPDWRIKYYGAWGSGANTCYTRLKSLTIEWTDLNDHNRYFVKKVNDYNTFPINFQGDEVENNYYTFENLDEGEEINYKAFSKQEADIGGKYALSNPERVERKGIYYEFYLKPSLDNNIETLEHKHRLLKIIYKPGIDQDLKCNNNKTFSKIGKDNNSKPKTQNDTSFLDRILNWLFRWFTIIDLNNVIK